MEEKDIHEKLNEEAVAEASETPAAEKAPAEPPKKKRKLKKWQIALICVGAFIVLLGIALGIFILVGSLNSHSRKSKQVDFDNKAPAYEVTFTAAELATINAGMKDNASEEAVKKAIALIYNKANYNKIHNVDSCLAVLRGEGSASLQIGSATPSGTMIVRGIKAQAGNEFYYQKAAPIMECSIDWLQATLEGALNQQERVYTNGTDIFLATGTLKGSAAKIKTGELEVETETVPFVKVNVPATINKYAAKSDFYTNGYYLEDPREITNFNITEDVIVLKDLEEGQSYIELVEVDDGSSYYLCRFSLDVTNDNCVKVARQYLRDSAGSDDLEYGYFDVVLEVWNNGYLKQMHDDEKWEGNVKIGGAKTSSTSWYETIVYYDYDEKLFTDEDAEEYEGDDEGASWVKNLIAHYKKEVQGISDVTNQ